MMEFYAAYWNYQDLMGFTESLIRDAAMTAAGTLDLTYNGKPVDLRPAKTYQSPYLNGGFGSDKVSVSVGPVHRQLDFSN
jgi:hypothetical protein